MIEQLEQMTPEERAYFHYRFKYHYGKDLNLTAPVDVSLELASECNMKCSYCYHADENKEHLPFTKGIMSKEIALKIVDHAAALGTPAIKFNWKGESTINPHFEEITAYAKSLARGSTFMDRLTNSNFKFRTTNERIFEGLANQTKVKVSYDSFRKDVFEVQRTGGDHDLTTRNVEKFYNHPARRRSGTQLVIQAVRTQRNKDEDIAGEVKRRWPDAQVSIRDMVAGRLEKDLSDIEVRRRNLDERQSCEQAHVRLIFNWEGKAFPCCPDISESLELGDIRTQDMRSIFNSGFAKKLRESLKSGEAFKCGPCNGCASWESFKGFKPVWTS